jgi:hypothetical protein
MNQELKSKIELFANNTQSLKGTFVWKNVLTKRLAALLYAAGGKQIDINALQESHDLIKESTGAFSYFRGNSAMTVSALLSLHKNQRKQLANTLDVYKRMKANKFWSSDYLVISAYQIAEGIEKEKYDETIKRTKAFYDGMKLRHRFLTGQADYAFAAMLALSDIEVEDGLKQIEDLYQALKPHFRSGDGAQTLSQVLTLGGRGVDLIAHVTDLADKLREKAMRFDRALTLPSLGVLSLLPTGADTLTDELVEVYELLRTKKGFGRWSVSNQELLMLSSALVAFHYADEANSDLLTTTLSTTITNIIIAQQTAIAVVIATSSSAAASSN